MQLTCLRFICIKEDRLQQGLMLHLTAYLAHSCWRRCAVKLPASCKQQGQHNNLSDSSQAKDDAMRIPGMLFPQTWL